MPVAHVWCLGSVSVLRISTSISEFAGRSCFHVAQVSGPCGQGYELQGYGAGGTTGFYYCHNWNQGTGSPATTWQTVSSGLAGVAECKALCDSDSTCTYFGKYGAYCDGACNSYWETKCLLIRQCGAQGLNSATSSYGAVYCEKVSGT